MSVPTTGEEYSKLIEHIRKAQEAAAMLAHIENANDNRKMAIGWLGVSEQLGLTVKAVTTFAVSKMQ